MAIPSLLAGTATTTLSVVSLDVPHLGNRTHVLHDGTDAIVVDPPRDTDAVEEVLETHGLRLAAVADTHVHSDFVSGSPALATRHRARYLLSADEPVPVERTGTTDGEALRFGGLEVRVIATPGHTPAHQAFLVSAADGAGPAALLSGGSLLDGTVGRTDLVDRTLTEALARAQWRTVRRLARLDPETLLLPTHGFGSLCAAATAGAGGTTIGAQLGSHPALVQDEQAFVRSLVDGFGPVPAHYTRTARLNRAGHGARRALPGCPVTAEDVMDAVLSGSWVVDLRTRAVFAERHLPGSIGIEHGAQMATYVGWLVPAEDDLVLLTDDPTQLTSAIAQLADLGIEGVGTHLLADEAPLTASYRRVGWDEVRERLATDEPPVLVDVRQRAEWEADHLPGALHLPIQDVPHRGPTLPSGELWVHCRSGYRAGIAASVLQRQGRSVVHVDDDWSRVGQLRLPTVRAAA